MKVREARRTRERKVRVRPHDPIYALGVATTGSGLSTQRTLALFESGRTAAEGFLEQGRSSDEPQRR
jgi:hypothetical protein